MDIPNQPQPQPEQTNPVEQPQVPAAPMMPEQAPVAPPQPVVVSPTIPQPAVVPPVMPQPVVTQPAAEPQKKSRMPLLVAIILIVVFGGLVLIFKPYASIKFYVRPTGVVASPSPLVSPSPTGLDAEAQAIVNQFQTAVQAGFLGQIAKGNIQKIYDEASPYLRQTVTMTILRQYIDAHPILKTNPTYELLKIAPISLTVGSTTVSGVQLIGNLGTTTANMMQNKLELQMLLGDNNTYLLSMIRAYAEQVLLSTTTPTISPKP